MIGGNFVKIDEGRAEEFKTRLTCLQDHDDPLSIYEQYLSILSPDPSRHLQGLEEATRAFVSDPRYKNDGRYLRIWMSYAKHCKEPGDVFAFLAVQGIGRELGVFYEEWANYVERRPTTASVERKWSEAERILRMGVEQGAQPLERLKKMFAEFLKRKLVALGETLPSPSPHPAQGRPSWSAVPQNTTNSWTSKFKDPKEKPKEIQAFKGDAALSFEEVRAQCWLNRSQSMEIEVDEDEEDDLKDVEDLAASVNPEDLTHISVYRDTTADVRELSKALKDVMMINEGLSRSWPINASTIKLKEVLGTRLVNSVDAPIALTPHISMFVEKKLARSVVLAVDLASAVDRQARVVAKQVDHRQLSVILQLPEKLLAKSLKQPILFDDCAVIVEEYLELGNLDNLLHTLDRHHQPMDNRVILFFTQRIVSLLSALLSSNWIHGNITLKHLLLTSSNEPLAVSNYQPEGSGGWGDRTLKLTGWEKALSADHKYILPEKDSPVGHEIDWRAAADCICRLLHVDHDSVAVISDHWQSLIRLLLNPPSEPQQAIKALEAVANRIDSALVSAQGNVSLKALLTRMEIMLMQS